MASTAESGEARSTASYPRQHSQPRHKSNHVTPEPSGEQQQEQQRQQQQQQHQDVQYVYVQDDRQARWAQSSFSEKQIRHAFIRKVYLILMAQLLFTGIVTTVFILVYPVKAFVQGNFWVFLIAIIAFIITYFVLICCDHVRRRTPGNYICLCVFTVMCAYLVGTITSYYDTYVVLIALGITSIVCLAVSLFAIQTRIDFTMCTGLIFVMCIVVLLFGMSCSIVFMVAGPNYIMSCVYGCLAAMLLSLFLAYDTQMLMGGRRHSLSPEEYIYGALQLYMDIVVMFLIMLGLSGGGQ